MPLYEYQCRKCGSFELIRKFADSPLSACPKCGSAVEKLLSAPAFQFKGTGWYVTDYARKGAAEKDGKGAAEKDGKGAAEKDGKTSERDGKTSERDGKSKDKDGSTRSAAESAAKDAGAKDSGSASGSSAKTGAAASGNSSK